MYGIKTAGIAGESLDVSKILAEQFLRSGVGIGMGTGAMLAINAANKRDSSVSRDKDFEVMLADNPDLLDHDLEKVKRHFDTVHKFAPDIAKHPTTAGSFVRSHLRFGDEGPTLGTIKDLIATQRDFEQSNHRVMAMDPIDRLAIAGKLQKG